MPTRLQPWLPAIEGPPQDHASLHRRRRQLGALQLIEAIPEGLEQIHGMDHPAEGGFADERTAPEAATVEVDIDRISSPPWGIRTGSRSRLIERLQDYISLAPFGMEWQSRQSELPPAHAGREASIQPH